MAVGVAQSTDWSIKVVKGTGESLETEYKEVGASFRACTKLGFDIARAILTLNGVLLAAFAFVNGGMYNPPVASNVRLVTLVLGVLGVASSAGALVMQWRAHAYWIALLERGAALDKKMGFHHYAAIKNIVQRQRVFGALGSSFSVGVSYGLLLIFWFVVLLSVVGVRVISIQL